MKSLVVFYDDAFFVSYYDDLSSSLCEFISLPTFHMFMTGIHMTPKTYLYSESVPRRWFPHNMHWNMIFPVLSEWMEFPVYQWKTRHDLLQKVHWNTIKKIFFPYKYDNTSLSKRKKRWISHFLYYWQNWYF